MLPQKTLNCVGVIVWKQCISGLAEMYIVGCMIENRNTELTSLIFGGLLGGANGGFNSPSKHQ